jgi:hypothetical protein
VSTPSTELRHVDSDSAHAQPTVSACCLTSGRRVERLAAILSLLRPVVGEVVVALDDRNASSARALTAVADRVVLFPHCAPSDRPIAWLHGLCSGEWIFNIDDDEVPSRALLAELPALARSTDVTHAWIARRWLYPDTATFIDEAPWCTEYQLRLVRSDPRSLQFSDEFHRPIVCDGPMRFVEAPLWHLDTAVNSREQRLAKAVAYERARPGMRVGAFSHNTGFYVPELRGDLLLAPVPPDDVCLIEGVLAARAPAGGAGSVEHAGRAQIDGAWPGEPHPSSLYDARIELVPPPGPLVAGVRQTITARLTNLGDRPWPRGGAITVGVRWDGATEGVRSSLPARVAPGATIALPVHVDPPAGAHTRLLEVDLVHEHVRWFGKTTRLTVEVTPRRQVAIVGSGEPLDEVLRALLLVPAVEPVILDWGRPETARYGHPRFGGVGGYLFGSEGTARSGALLRTARLLHRPGAHLALAGFERLLVAGDGCRPGAPPRRERLYVLATAAAARRLRVPVTRIAAGEPVPGVAGRALDRLAPPATVDALRSLLQHAPAGHRDTAAG